MWSILGRFAGIGRVILSREGGNVALVSVVAWLYVWKLWVRGKVCPPAQEFGKRGGVFRILMPTAPTRIKLSPRPSCQCFRIFYPPCPLMFRSPALRHKTAPRVCLEETFPRPSVITSTSLAGRALFWVTFSPSGCGCALPRGELRSILERFGGIGRVVLSWEGENGAHS